jgi:hypothetical protein
VTSNQPSTSASSAQQPATSSKSSPPKEVKITVEIISERRFQVRTSSYNQQVIDEMRKINSKSWSKLKFYFNKFKFFIYYI